MPRIISILSVLLVLASFSLDGQDRKFKITLMTNWTPQAQFAGYYVAKEKGFFDEAGLDVTVQGFSPSSNDDIFSWLNTGKIDAMVFQMAGAVKHRAEGMQIVNILQTSQVNGLVFVSSSPVHYLKDLSGLRIGIWKNDVADVAKMALTDNKVIYSDIPVLQSMSIFYAGAVDAILVYTFNEYIQILFRQGEIPEDNVVRISDLGYNFPEDGLYVTEKYMNKHPKEVKAFADACRRGWEYAASHREEALEITMKYITDARAFTTRQLQKMMLDEILRLQINPKTGTRDFAPVSEDVFNDIQNKLFRVGLISRTINYREICR